MPIGASSEMSPVFLHFRERAGASSCLWPHPLPRSLLCNQARLGRTSDFTWT